MRLDEMKKLPPEEQKKIYNRLKKERHKGKTTVYSATYGVGKEKLSRELGVSQQEAQSLLDAFWKRNWAIREFAKQQKTKVVGKQTWIYNPVSKFWYSLRFEKDRWSTLNQGTGVYAFDTWLSFVLKERPQLTGQFHDEIVLDIVKGHREKSRELLERAIEKTNDKLKLNVKLEISMDWGDTYSEIH